MADVEIRLGAKTYNLRPTFGAMREIEAKTESSCATLLNMLARSELHSSEMALIVYYGMVEADEKPTDPEAVGNRLFEAGIGSQPIRDAVAAYLGELLWAPDKTRKKAAGEWWRAIEEITSLMFSVPPISSDGDHETSGQPLPESSGQSSPPSVKNRKP